MIIIRSAQNEVSTVAERWKRAYLHSGGWTNCLGGSERIYTRLAALPSTADAKDVAAVIGNDSWVGDMCSECRKHSSDIVQCGEDPDYESATVYLCFDCARKYAAFINKHVR